MTIDNDFDFNWQIIHDALCDMGMVCSRHQPNNFYHLAQVIREMRGILPDQPTVLWNEFKKGRHYDA